MFKQKHLLFGTEKGIPSQTRLPKLDFVLKITILFATIGYVFLNAAEIRNFFDYEGCLHEIETVQQILFAAQLVCFCLLLVAIIWRDIRKTRHSCEDLLCWKKRMIFLDLAAGIAVLLHNGFSFFYNMEYFADKAHLVYSDHLLLGENFFGNVWRILLLFCILLRMYVARKEKAANDNATESVSSGVKTDDGSVS